MVGVVIIVVLLWIGLPILVEVVTHFTTKFWLKLSYEPGFWEFMSGEGLASPAKSDNPASKIHGVKSVKLTKDWELPTLERCIQISAKGFPTNPGPMKTFGWDSQGSFEVLPDGSKRYFETNRLDEVKPASTELINLRLLDCEVMERHPLSSVCEMCDPRRGKDEHPLDFKQRSKLDEV